ncbi:F-box domain protein [Pandoravirus inopinatum]|uniref:F-box domain protein n=1 Tax=Pandoravirus inopinatum TaxID=1605721 RepID=A0A0B5J1K0_9VIRU|nr:F-box domain protein [Pandoravirus inopinatum]AJF97384.1 F-box domain protein [Pandoravirus inopinatum]
MDVDADRSQYGTNTMSALPPELWEAILGGADQVGGLDPASLLALASTGRVGQQIVRAATQPFYAVRSPSEPPVLRRIPADEYARLATNFGVTSRWHSFSPWPTACFVGTLRMA